jgi:hypothetical protein
MIAFESGVGGFAVIGLAGLAFVRGRFRSLADAETIPVLAHGDAGITGFIMHRQGRTLKAGY